MADCLFCKIVVGEIPAKIAVLRGIGNRSNALRSTPDSV